MFQTAKYFESDKIMQFLLNCRESSVELRELESKLRQAYINKELCAQLTEKEKAKKIQQLQVKKMSN